MCVCVCVGKPIAEIYIVPGTILSSNHLNLIKIVRIKGQRTYKGFRTMLGIGARTDKLKISAAVLSRAPPPRVAFASNKFSRAVVLTLNVVLCSGSGVFPEVQPGYGTVSPEGGCK